MIIKPILSWHLTQRLDLLNIDTTYFEGMVNQIYSPELQLNKANTLDTEATFLDLRLFLTVLFSLKFIINASSLLWSVYFSTYKIC